MKKILLCAALLAFTLGSVRAQSAGTIIAFAGEVNKVPSGYLICNGKSYAQKGEYKRLFEAIGKAWGGNNTEFNVPDLRGLFLRGVNGSRTGPYSDSDADKRIGGNRVGSLQLDTLKSHTHSQWILVGPHYEGGNGNIPNSNGSTQTGAYGGNETRPKNAYVYYLIKVKN